MTRASVWVRAALVATALLLVAGPAQARYPLDQVLPQKAAARLAKAGITTTMQLVKKGRWRKARARLAKKTGVKAKKLYDWVRMADLMRVRGVGPEMSRLLSAAGVKTIAKLRHQRAAALLKRLDKVNRAKKITGNMPSKQYVAHWIKQAKKLKVMVR